MENLLKIRDLHVEYHTEDDVVRAVNGLNLDLYKGETLGLVGETGAGKTTTALSVMNLLPDRWGIWTCSTPVPPSCGRCGAPRCL